MSIGQPNWSDLVGPDDNLSFRFFPMPPLHIAEELSADPTILRLAFPRGGVINPSQAQWHRVYDGRVGRMVHILCFHDHSGGSG